MSKIVIFGATSAIAEHTARYFASEGAELVLIGRNEKKLEVVASDLEVRGGKVTGRIISDLCIIAKHEELFEQILEMMPDFDTVLIAHGTLADQEQCQKDFSSAQNEIEANFTSQASLLTIVANHLEGKKAGTIAAISSVAGDRGRKSNYIYGAAKGALTLFLAGLRNRLSDAGVKVVTIKPGFVSTPMTAHLEQGPLFAKPEVVGKAIYAAIKSGKDIVYVPFFWRYIMLIIKHIPEFIFKKMSI